MISSWRSDRRIGPLTAAERLRGALVTPLVIVCGAAVAATLVLFIRLAFGGSLWPQLTLWPLTFAVIAGAVVISTILGRRWLESAITVGLIVLVFCVAKELSMPIFSAIHGHEGVVIVPVNS